MCRIKNLRVEPFSKFSAEEELDVLNEIFYKPPFYNQLLNLIVDGNSRFILGQRGQGKSAIIHKLFHDLSQKNTLPLLITRYDGVPQTNNTKYFLYIIIQNITLGLAKRFSEDKSLLKHLSKCQRTKFNVLLEMFYDIKWAPDFVETANTIRNKKRTIWWQRKWNNNLKHINDIADGVLRVTAEIIRRTLFGDSSFNFDDAHHDYFSTINVDKFNSFTIDGVDNVDLRELMDMLGLLLDLSKDVGFESIIILFDKIDEYPLLKSDVEKVSVFMQDLLSDTDFLYTPKLGVVFSLWSEVKRNLNSKGIRFDKFQDVDIRWKDEDLERIMNHRLAFYSINKESPVTLGALIPEDSTKKLVLELADKSPPPPIINIAIELYILCGRKRGDNIILSRGYCKRNGPVLR